MTILQKHLVFIPLFFIVFVGLFGLIVMGLWNWIMPDLLGLHAISYWQAVGLLILCKILFGGFGGGHHHGHGHACGHGRENRLRQSWESMTPEERECFIAAHKDCRNASDTDCDGK